MSLARDFRDGLAFLGRERPWTLLFLLLLGLAAAAFFLSPVRPAEGPSEAVQKLQAAEERLKEELREVGSVKNYLADRPGLLLVFNLFSLMLLAAFAAGLVLDLLWFTRPEWRGRLQSAHGPPEALSWSNGTVFKVLLLFMVSALGLGLAFSAVRAWFFPRASADLFSLIHTTAADLLAVLLVFSFVSRGGGDWRGVGFREVRPWRDFWTGLAGYAAVVPFFFLVLLGVALAAYLLSYQPPPHPLVEIFLEEEEGARGLIAYSIFLACVAGPVFEEIFFRGFCYPAFKQRWGRGWALFLSSAFFASSHQNIFAFLPIFVLGLGLGYLYEKRGTLVPSIVLHIVHNTIFISYFFLAKEVLAGGP